MGNCMCIGHVCQSHDHSIASPPHVPPIRVVHSSDLRISEFREQSMKAAELMLDFPNHFLVQLENGNCRPLPLPADADLKPWHAYLLLPMHRMNARVSQEDMSSFISAVSQHQYASAPANNPKSKLGPKASMYGQSRVAPLMQADEEGDADHGSDSEQGTRRVSIQNGYSWPAMATAQLDNGIPACVNRRNRNTITGSRPWVPKLETISESLHVPAS